MKTFSILAAAILILAGCAPDAPKEPAQDRYQVTTRWIPNPLVDLMSPEGTFLRAAAESWDQVWSSPKFNVEAIRDRAYPGFEQAFNNSFHSSFGGFLIKGLIVGTQYFEVVNFQRAGDQFIADVCNYSSQVASQTDDGKYTSGGRIKYSHSARSFVFGPNPALQPNQQHSPPSRQRGPANRPIENVFGTWVLTDVSVRQMDDAAWREFANRCDRPAPGTPDNLPNPYVRADPPPMLPPDPGWPDASSA